MGGSFIFWSGSHISGGMAMGLFKCNQAHVVGIIRPLDWDRVNVSDNLGATPVSPVVTPMCHRVHLSAMYILTVSGMIGI